MLEIFWRNLQRPNKNQKSNPSPAPACLLPLPTQIAVATAADTNGLDCMGDVVQKQAGYILNDQEFNLR